MLKWFLLKSLRFYKRFISPSLPSACRFTPTCSVYMYEAIEVYGPFKGTWMGTKRIMSCHPMNPGGYDPVPPKE